MRRIEYALQWFISVLVINIDGYPALSGLATSILLTFSFWQHRLLIMAIMALSGRLR